ncbi:hypothetical protein [Aureimonas sp. AU12]|uniref:hypothetical protein n=1 Tax=Aureimonas sp. AU12 TaxID=1638161 RepID=UPI0007857791|nr:hypothetical protein [Aureimonas sp. AU12]
MAKIRLHLFAIGVAFASFLTSAPPIYRGLGPHPALRTSSLFQLDDDEEREILVAIVEGDDGDDDDPSDDEEGSIA